MKRFWNRVNKSGDCWLWTRGKNNHGYGCMFYDGKQTLAHRLSYEFAFGPIPPDKQINHRCNTPLCVNPSHLYAGTQKENMADKQRGPKAHRGSSHPRAKLNEAEVREIKWLLHWENTGRAIAKEFSVDPMTVSLIKRKKSWQHVKGPE